MSGVRRLGQFAIFSVIGSSTVIEVCSFAETIAYKRASEHVSSDKDTKMENDRDALMAIHKAYSDRLMKESDWIWLRL